MMGGDELYRPPMVALIRSQPLYGSHMLYVATTLELYHTKTGLKKFSTVIPTGDLAGQYHGTTQPSKHYIILEDNRYPD